MSRLGWIDAPRASLTQWDDLTRFADALVVLDSTDPAAVLAIERAGIGNTLFVISSKSGTTVETLAFYHYFVARARQRFRSTRRGGGEGAGAPSWRGAPTDHARRMSARSRPYRLSQ